MHSALRLVSDSAAECAADPLLIQGAGGNVSLKDGDTFWIKASGKWLKNAKREDVFVGLDWSGVRQWMDTGDDDVPLRYVRHNQSLRPSIETSLHVVMPQRVVLHTHPVDVVALAVRVDARSSFETCLHGLPWAWIPYSRPGRDLTESVRTATHGQSVSILILGNHGLVVGADTAMEAVDVTTQIVGRCRQAPRATDESMATPVLLRLCEDGDFQLPAHTVTHALARDPVALEYFSREPNVLYPDQAVFLGDRITRLEGQQLSAMRPTAETSPYAVVPQVGVVIAGRADQMVDMLLRFHAEVLLRVPKGATLNYLTPMDIEALLDWEPEKYRQSLKYSG